MSICYQKSNSEQFQQVGTSKKIQNFFLETWKETQYHTASQEFTRAAKHEKEKVSFNTHTHTDFIFPLKIEFSMTCITDRIFYICCCFSKVTAAFSCQTLAALCSSYMRTNANAQQQKKICYSAALSKEFACETTSD